MKPILVPFIVAVLLGLTCTYANAIDMRDLSLTPFEACKKPANTPPRALLHKDYDAYGTSSNYPFDATVDINGDGWCDWVSMAAGAPHRGDVDEPVMADFIFLGTAKGWRKFGDMKRLRSDHSETAWLAPNVPVFNFIDPTLVYSKNHKKPFIVVLSSNEDIAPTSPEDISVFQWDDMFDMPRDVTSTQVEQTVLQFLRIKLCEAGKVSTNKRSLASVLCEKHNRENHP